MFLNFDSGNSQVGDGRERVDDFFPTGRCLHHPRHDPLQPLLLVVVLPAHGKKSRASSQTSCYGLKGGVAIACGNREHEIAGCEYAPHLSGGTLDRCTHPHFHLGVGVVLLSGEQKALNALGVGGQRL